MKTYHTLSLLLILLFINKVSFAETNPLIFKADKLDIILQDHLHHPYYWWPATLLNYTVIFDKEPKAGNFAFFDESNGIEAPFQFSEVVKLSDGKYKAVLSFISDLPSGEKKTFTLRRSSSPKDFPPVKVANEKEYIVIETDKLKVRLACIQGQ